MAVRSNRMHIQALEGRPQNYLAFLTFNSRSPKKWFVIADKNRLNEVYARFKAFLTLKIGQTGTDGQPDA
uniref:Uncharacterized protein n=1 Tax=Solanum lycopersicum TaxID=4081 RepID=A0A3Q7I6I7_SOLLC